MRSLFRKPFTLALLLTLPLWIALGNIVIGFCVALLVAFLASMIDSLLVLKKTQTPKNDRPNA